MFASWSFLSDFLLSMDEEKREEICFEFLHFLQSLS